MLFLLFVSILLSISPVQTKLGRYFTNKINKDFGTNLTIKKVDFSFLGSVKLRGIEIRDHHKDTLIFVDKLTTSVLNARKILNNEVYLGPIYLEDAYYHMKTYKGEEDDNMAVFIDSFDDGKEKNSLNPFILKSENVYVDNLDFKLVNENTQDSLLYFTNNAGGNLQDLSIIGPDFSANIV